MIVSKISLETAKNGVQKNVFCKSGETAARELIITLTANGNIIPLSVDEEPLFGCLAYMYDTGTGITSSINPPVIENASLVFSLPPAMPPGEKIIEFKLTGNVGAEVVYSPQFRIMVEKSLDYDAIIEAYLSGIQYEEKFNSSQISELISADDYAVIVDKTTGATKLISLDDIPVEWSNIGNKPTTLAGYGITDAYTKNETDENLDEKVDKVEGKDLSENDYTDSEKNKVAESYAAKHTHSNKALLDAYSQTENDLADAVNKKHTHSNKAILDATTVPFTTSSKSAIEINSLEIENILRRHSVVDVLNTYEDLEEYNTSFLKNNDVILVLNDNGYICSAFRWDDANDEWDWVGNAVEKPYTKAEIITLISKKVDKISGKGLSSEDYTTAEKSKLAGISANAKNVSVSASGTATDEVGYITVDGVEKKLAPPSTEISNISSIERIASYLYKITFRDIPEYTGAEVTTPACSSFVQNGKLHRNLDWYYDEAPSFLVKCKGFEGIAIDNSLTDTALDMHKLAQLPYRITDGVNDYGIMCSAHILFNDWDWHGSGNKTVPLSTITYHILTKVQSMDSIETDLADVIANISVNQTLEDSEYLMQFLITDGTTIYALLPPTTSSGTYSLVDITENPKLTNFRWVDSEMVERSADYMQDRPTGVERWNAMPCNMQELRFTKCYESPDRLSEFIGINDTDKTATDEELTAIYTLAHDKYLERTRNGELWQTVHSAVYSSNGLEGLYVQENWDKNYIGSSESTEYTTKVALGITPPAMLVAEYEDGYGWDALYSAYQEGKKLSVEINTEDISSFMDGRTIRAEINELKEDAFHSIVLFRTDDVSVNITSAEIVFSSDGMIALEHFEALAFRSELEAQYMPYDNDTSGLEAQYVQDAIDELAEEKQDNLVSGTNIKTINNQSILGSGNLNISAHINGEYILRATDWEPDGTEYTLELSDTSFLADADYDVCPPPSYLNAYGFCGIYAVSQTDGTITFRAKSLPNEDLYVYITRRM